MFFGRIKVWFIFFIFVSFCIWGAKYDRKLFAIYKKLPMYVARARSNQMMPTFGYGNYLFVNSLAYKKKEPSRGDVVLYDMPMTEDGFGISRIVGLGGETLELKEGALLINNAAVSLDGVDVEMLAFGRYGLYNEKIFVPRNHYYLVDDNGLHGFDSRQWGFLPKENVLASVKKIF